MPEAFPARMGGYTFSGECCLTGFAFRFIMSDLYGPDASFPVKGRGAGRGRRDSGGYSGGVPPLPIPNREVKPARADGTAHPWESR